MNAGSAPESGDNLVPGKECVPDAAWSKRFVRLSAQELLAACLELTGKQLEVYIALRLFVRRQRRDYYFRSGLMVTDTSNWHKPSQLRRCLYELCRKRWAVPLNPSRSVKQCYLIGRHGYDPSGNHLEVYLPWIRQQTSARSARAPSDDFLIKTDESLFTISLAHDAALMRRLGQVYCPASEVPDERPKQQPSFHWGPFHVPPMADSLGTENSVKLSFERYPEEWN